MRGEGKGRFVIFNAGDVCIHTTQDTPRIYRHPPHMHARSCVHHIYIHSTNGVQPGHIYTQHYITLTYSLEQQSGQ